MTVLFHIDVMCLDLGNVLKWIMKRNTSHYGNMTKNVQFPGMFLTSGWKHNLKMVLENK